MYAYACFLHVHAYLKYVYAYNWAMYIDLCICTHTHAQNLNLNLFCFYFFFLFAQYASVLPYFHAYKSLPSSLFVSCASHARLGFLFKYFFDMHEQAYDAWVLCCSKVKQSHEHAFG